MPVCFYHNSKDGSLICDICKNNICSDDIVYFTDNTSSESGNDMEELSNFGGYCIPCTIQRESEKKIFVPYLLIIGGFALTLYSSAFYRALFLVGPIMVYFGFMKWTAFKSKEAKMKLRLAEFDKSINEDKIRVLEGN